MVNNVAFSYYILIALGAIVVSMIIYRVAIDSVQYTRTLTCLNNDGQRYFKMPNQKFGWIKQHLVYAPLFRRRHHKQMRIGPMETGILPTRFQSLLLAGIIAMNVILCACGIEWNGPTITKLEHLRNRSGTLAVANMIPLVILAGRNNPLIGWLNIPYDTFNLMHRWFGRIVASLAVSHGVVGIMALVIRGQKTHTPGWESFSGTLKEVRFITFGLVVSHGQQSKIFLFLLTDLIGACCDMHHNPNELDGFPPRFLRDFLAHPHRTSISNHGRSVDPSGWPPGNGLPESRNLNLGHRTSDPPLLPHLPQRRPRRH